MCNVPSLHVLLAFFKTSMPMWCGWKSHYLIMMYIICEKILNYAAK